MTPVQELSSYLVSVMEELEGSQAPPVLSRELIVTVISLKSKGNEDWFPLHPFAGYFSTHFPTMSRLLHHPFSILLPSSHLPPSSTLLPFAISLWNQQKLIQSVEFACDFHIETQFQIATNAFLHLIDGNKTDLALKLMENAKEIANEQILCLIERKKVKLAGKLMEQSGISGENYPEVVKELRQNAIRYYLNTEEWDMRQLVDVVKDNSEDLSLIVRELYAKCRVYADISQGEVQKGVLIARILTNFPNILEVAEEVRRNLPRHSMNNHPFFPVDAFGPLDPAALHFPDPKNTIHFVSSLQDFLETDLESTDLVGLDCEWKPNLTKLQLFPVSILQISTLSSVYILDLPRLAQFPDVLNHKLSNLFLNPSISKLGLNFSCDKSHLMASYPQIPCFSECILSYIDLQLTYKSVFPEETGSGGLAMLCNRFLNCKLCKGEQISDWELRPLRESQLHYAALDAKVEVMIWQEIRKHAQNRGFSLENMQKTLGNTWESVKIPEIREKMCGLCGENSHTSKRCPKARICDLCHEVGHMCGSCPEIYPS